MMKIIDKETEPEITPLAIVNSLIMEASRPEDRKPDEMQGYYFDFFVHPDEYPGGAAIVIQWAFRDGETIIAGPIHAIQWAEYWMRIIERDMNMLPEVATLLFNVLKAVHIERENRQR
jgi:hypothetical protein